MHLYPNFDFFDLDYSDGVNSNSHSNNSNSSNFNYQSTQQVSAEVVPNQLVVGPSSNKSNSPNEYLPPRNSSTYQLYSTNNEVNDSKANIIKANDSKSLTNSSQVALLRADHQQQQYALMNQQNVSDSSDLYNFNTLVSAAVGMPNIAQNDIDNSRIRSHQSQPLLHSDIKVSPKNGKKIGNVMNATKLKHHQQQQQQQLTASTSFNTEQPIIYSSNQQQPLQQVQPPPSSLNLANTELQMPMNGPSNTIRNLLAQQPSHLLQMSEPIVQIPNNIRPSGGNEPII